MKIINNSLNSKLESGNNENQIITCQNHENQYIIRIPHQDHENN